jgi:LDH2 family malate/lactate/ureidoglycolate dehydrogenase
MRDTGGAAGWRRFLWNRRQQGQHLIFAIDPELLTDRKTLSNNVSEIIRKVKSTKKLARVDEIFVPGERESHLARQRRESGLIEVEDNLLAELRKVAGG